MNHQLIQLTFILAAVILNRGDRRLSLLSLIIGFSLVVPVYLFTTYESFPIVCSLFELAWIIAAIRLQTKAAWDLTWIVCSVWVMLIFHHLIALGFDNEPYIAAIKSLEYTQILACSLYSKPVIDFIKTTGRTFAYSVTFKFYY